MSEKPRMEFLSLKHDIAVFILLRPDILWPAFIDITWSHLHNAYFKLCKTKH